MALTNTVQSATHISFSAPFAAFGRAVVRMAERHPCMRQIEKLNNTSDEELAARGLTRDDVVRHIFRERFYI